MPTPSSALAQLNLDAVAAGCRDEAQRSRHQELGYCFELFRRALEQAEQGAWHVLATQYRRLVLEWIHAARRAATEDSDPEELAQEAFERFWRTLVGRCNPLTARFPHVGALLKYLQQCAVTTVLDQRRRAMRQARLNARVESAHTTSGISAGPEDATVARIDQAALLARVREWVAAEVHDADERLVLQASYTDDLSPAEIAARYPDRFTDAALVRQIKERVLRRARRALLDGTTDSATLSSAV